MAFRNSKTHRHSEIKKTRPSTKQDLWGKAMSKQNTKASLASLSCNLSWAPTEWSAIFAPSKICRILHIPWKLNSILALLVLQNIVKLWKEKMISLCFCSPKTTQPPGFLGQWFNNLQQLHFWCYFDVTGSIMVTNLQQAALLMSLVQYEKVLSRFGQQELVMVNYVTVWF